MDKYKILIIGGGRCGPTYRNALYMEALLQHGFDVEYKSIADAEPFAGNKADLVAIDFEEMELRMLNALNYGTSHPEMLLGNPDDIHWPVPLRELPPDKRKGPKGPRNRWGKL